MPFSMVIDDSRIVTPLLRFIARFHLRHFGACSGIFVNSCDCVLCDKNASQPCAANFLKMTQWIPEAAICFSDDGADDKELNENQLRICNENLTMVKLAILSFLRAVASVTPIVLVLDDMMLSKTSSLDFLQFILMDKALSNVLFCAAYRNEEVDNQHPMTKWRDAISKERKVETILLKDLSLEEIQKFLSAALNLEDEELDDLPKVLLERTNGNPMSFS
jgi:hypothetical protein